MENFPRNKFCGIFSAELIPRNFFRSHATEPSTSIQNSYHSLLRDNFQLAQSSALNLTAHYTNLINTYTNRAIDCFKVACADNVVYSYSSWKLQCVHDTTFTKFCWDDVIPRNVHRCPSAKAESLNACLDEVSL